MRISPSNKPLVLVTMGDSRGIGPEILIPTLQDRSLTRLADLILIGELASMKKAAKTKRARVSFNEIGLRELSDPKKRPIKRGSINIINVDSEDKGRAPVEYIDAAISLIESGLSSALATAPVNKEAITRSGIKFQGHTEYLAARADTKKVAMMFTGGRLKVTVVTRHIPLKDVSRALTIDKIKDAALLTYAALRRDFKIERPKIGVCALNPHAGEGGTIGLEERDIISPAIKALKPKIRAISGPIPADSAFNLLYNGKVDSLIAMYHDQALIPVKTLGRQSCVNVTLGLPYARTSPVHGTAYDIAYKGVADPSSMREAVRLACRLAKH
ncbi:MAG: 4-hydroxythreonine-4-phosphate dehydrogenase PdxA [Candidatus Omnitrophota bacterium]